LLAFLNGPRQLGLDLRGPRLKLGERAAGSPLLLELRSEVALGASRRGVRPKEEQCDHPAGYCGNCKRERQGASKLLVDAHGHGHLWLDPGHHIERDPNTAVKT
jgi:hypothetical protein